MWLMDSCPCSQADGRVGGRIGDRLCRYWETEGTVFVVVFVTLRPRDPVSFLGTRPFQFQPMHRECVYLRLEHRHGQDSLKWRLRRKWCLYIWKFKAKPLYFHSKWGFVLNFKLNAPFSPVILNMIDSKHQQKQGYSLALTCMLSKHESLTEIPHNEYRNARLQPTQMWTTMQ